MKFITSPKRLILALAAAASAVPLLIAAACDLPEDGPATTSAAGGNGNSNNKQKVCICHHAGNSGHTKTLCLPPPAAQAHLNRHQGDTPGPCS